MTGIRRLPRRAAGPLLVALVLGLPRLRAATHDPEVPSAPPAFEVLASTRRVTGLLAVGDRLLVGTTGGLVVLESGARRLHLPGIPVRGLLEDPGSPGTAYLATDSGLYRIGPHRVDRLRDGACSAVAIAAGRPVLARPDGRLESLDGSPLPALGAGSSPITALIAHRGALLGASLDGLRTPGPGAAPALSADDPLAAHVTALAELGGRVFAGTPVGAFARDGGAWRPIPTATKHPPHVTCLGLGLDGSVLAGTAGEGIWRLTGGRLAPWKKAPAVVTALAAHRGALWVGTPDTGAAPLGHAGEAPSLGGDEPPSNAITALAWAREWQTLAVGTFDRGLGLRRDGAWRRAGLGAGLPSDWVNQVASDGRRLLVRLSDGNVFAARGSDAWVGLGRREGWPKDWTSALGSDRDRIWVGTRNAFYLSLQEPWEVFAPKPELEGVDVLDVAFRESEAWLATHRHGLLRWDRWRNRFERITHGAGLADPWVTQVEVFRGRVYAGTFDGGLVEVEDDGPGSPVRAVRAVPIGPGGLPSPAIEALLATDERLWVGTLDGLADSADGRSWNVHGSADGLPSSHVTSLASDGTRLWVGTESGLAVLGLGPGGNR